jgi:hypothetical protein
MVMRSRVWNIRGLVAGLGLVMGAVAVTRRYRQVPLEDLQVKKRRRVNFQRLRRCRLVVDMDALIRVQGRGSFSIRMDLS